MSAATTTASILSCAVMSLPSSMPCAAPSAGRCRRPCRPAFGAVTRCAVQRVDGPRARRYTARTSAIREIGLAEVRGDKLSEVLADAVARGCSVVCDGETERDIELVGGAFQTVDATPVGSYGWPGPGPERETAIRTVATACSRQSVASSRRRSHRSPPRARPESTSRSSAPTSRPRARPFDGARTSCSPPSTRTLQHVGAIAGDRTHGRGVTGLFRDTAPGGLVVVGGELASELIRSLGVEQLDVICEPWPAVPVVRLRGRRLDGLAAAMKSGAREGSDWLISSCACLARSGARSHREPRASTDRGDDGQPQWNRPGDLPQGPRPRRCSHHADWLLVGDLATLARTCEACGLEVESRPPRRRRDSEATASAYSMWLRV